MHVSTDVAIMMKKKFTLQVYLEEYINTHSHTDVYHSMICNSKN